MFNIKFERGPTLKGYKVFSGIVNYKKALRDNKFLKIALRLNKLQRPWWGMILYQECLHAP